MTALKDIRTRWRFDPLGKTEKQKKRLYILTLILLLAGAGLLSLLSLNIATLYPNSVRFLSYFLHPGLVILNVLPVVLLTFFLFFLTNSAWVSLFLSGLVILLGTFGSFFKAVFRDSCAVFEDLLSLEAAAGIAGEYQISFSIPMLASVAAWLAACAVLAFFARGKGKKFLPRLGLAILTAAIFLGAFRLWYLDDKLYNSFDNYIYFSQWKEDEKYASHGFLYPFLHSYRDAFPMAPEGYDKKTAEQWMNQYPDTPLSKKVNIVSVMLESFSELELDYQEDPYTPWRELKKESYCGTLISDTMGGGTVNSERSFLTGFYYPQPSYHHAVPSVVSYMKDQGYETFGAHPGFAWFYSREDVNRNLGFDEYRFMEDYFSDFTGEEHADDETFFMGLRRLYEQKQSPSFSFSISYQNHSPYDSSVLHRGKIYYRNDDMEEGSVNILNNYLGGVADTAQKVSAFVDTFRADEEPVVLIFFGDHRATMGASNSVYHDLGISMDITTDEGMFNYYATPYLIWANDAAKKVLGTDVTGEGPTMGPYYLMAEAFRVCHLEGPGYLKLQQEVMQAIPVVHATHRYLTEDGFTKELTQAQSALLQKQQSVSYYRQTKRK